MGSPSEPLTPATTHQPLVAGVVSVNIGTTATLGEGERAVETAIFKFAQRGPVSLGALGFAGDEQADLKNHGGPDKAVNVYPVEHFAEWSRRVGRPFVPAAFGENLTSEGWLEEEAYIGDVYRIGTAVVQITQPRQPCYKLGLKWNEPRLVRWVVQSGRTGFYLRCVEPGRIAAGDRIELVDRPANSVTVAQAHQTMHFLRADRQAVQRLRIAPGLSRAWIDALTRGA